MSLAKLEAVKTVVREFDEDACAERIRSLVKNTAGNLLQIGFELTVAKKRLPHGRFEAWVQEKCRFTPRTARMLMVAYEQNKQSLAEIWEHTKRKLASDLLEPLLYNVWNFSGCDEPSACFQEAIHLRM